MVRLSLTHNTPSDIVKAVGVGVATFVSSFTVANAEGGVSVAEWIGVGIAVVSATLAALGLYVPKEEQS